MLSATLLGLLPDLGPNVFNGVDQLAVSVGRSAAAGCRRTPVIRQHFGPPRGPERHPIDDGAGQSYTCRLGRPCQLSQPQTCMRWYELCLMWRPPGRPHGGREDQGCGRFRSSDGGHSMHCMQYTL